MNHPMITKMAQVSLCAGFHQGIHADPEGRVKPYCVRIETAPGRYKIHVRVVSDHAVAEALLFENHRRLIWKGALRAGIPEDITALCAVHPYMSDGSSEIRESQGIELALIAPGARIEAAWTCPTNVRALLLMGDSTVTDQSAFSPYAPGAAYGGWGQMLPLYLGESACVINFARSGLTAETFREQGYYALVKSQIQPGDLVAIQFGHNDQKCIHLQADVGYMQLIVGYIQEIKALGAQPIIVTPLARNSWLNAHTYNDLLCRYAAAAKRAAQDQGVFFIDLHRYMMDFIIHHGQDAVKPYFHIGDYTHTNDFGAYMVAGYIASKLHEQKLLTAPPLKPWLPRAPFDAPQQNQGSENPVVHSGCQTNETAVFNPLSTLVTADSITLYWEKPEDAVTNQLYSIWVDGKETAVVNRTHFTLHDLSSETAYTFCVCCSMGEKTLRMQAAVRTAKPRKRIDVTKPPYHAVGDGQSLNTAALQRAFDDCGKEDCIYFPPGVYMTGALRGHSDMEIYLDDGAVLQGTAEIADYLPRIRSRFEGIEQTCYSSLLNFGTLNHADGPNCRNVLIHGKGKIASGGQKLAWRIIEDEREKLSEYLAENAELVATCENNHTIPGRVRPRLINMSNCEGVRISGLTLENGASWNVHMVYSRNIITDHCTFRSQGVWNGDGWDPDSSENCTLFASAFYTEDDAVAIKSGKNPEGNKINRPTRHIRVFDCYSAYGHGIVIGSEMSGGIDDVKIWDCDLRISMSGFEIKATKKRGGYVKNISVRDCVLPRVMIHSVLYNDDGVSANTPPMLENFQFERLALTGLYQATQDTGNLLPCPPIEVIGFDAPGYEAKRVTFKDITIADGRPGLIIRNAKHISLENITCQQEV